MYLSSKQIEKLITVRDEVFDLMLKNKDDSIFRVISFYVLNMEKFDFDFSDEEFDALCNILEWYYYDEESGKIKRIK